MSVELVRFFLRDTNSSSRYDPAVIYLFVDAKGMPINDLETFGHWGIDDSDTSEGIWPFRLLAGKDGSLMDFGFTRGDDPKARYGTTNIREQRIVEEAEASFEWMADRFAGKISNIIVVCDRAVFRPGKLGSPPAGPPATS